jgi:hypothetical protein
MEVNEKEIQKLEKRIDKLETDLDKAKERLGKIKPCKPLTHENTLYDNKKKELVTSCEYWCPYCGEQLYKPKSKAVSKHKCGQMIDWK